MSVESAMHRIARADQSQNRTDDSDHQHEMYEKSLRVLEAIDGDDDNEGVPVVTEWIID